MKINFILEKWSKTFNLKKKALILQVILATLNIQVMIL